MCMKKEQYCDCQTVSGTKCPNTLKNNFIKMLNVLKCVNATRLKMLEHSGIMHPVLPIAI